MSSRMPVLLALVVGVLGGALIGGSALLGASAQSGTTSSAASTSASSAGTTKACGWRLGQLPAELRADLRAARALPAGERGPALRKIAKAARSGDYGKQVQKIAQKRFHHHRVVRGTLPADLKADLRKARQLPAGAERKAALKEIRKHALAGDYGTQAKKVAERRKAHRADCRASRGGTTA